MNFRLLPAVWRTISSIVVLTTLVGIVPTTAHAEQEPALGIAGIDLIAQSPWIADDGNLVLELRITGKVERTQLRVGLHNPVDRRELTTLRDGGLTEAMGVPVEIDVASVRNSAGVASLNLTVGPTGALRSRPGGVYPLVVQLIDADKHVLDQLITPLVHLPVIPEGEAALHRPLLIGLTATIQGPPTLKPNGRIDVDESTFRQLEGLVRSVLEHPGIPIDIGLPPSTIDGLARSNDLAHTQLLTDLVLIAKNNRVHLRSMPYVTADPEAWRQADRVDIFQDLLNHGDQAVAEQLGADPDRRVTVLDPTAVPATLDLLESLGTRDFVVSASRLDPRPVTASHGATHPARLFNAQDLARTSLVADPDLTRHLTDSQGPVYAAQYLLADLALLAWADPTVARSAIVAIPEEIPADGTTLHLVMGILQDAPFLRVRSLPELFQDMQAFDAAAAVNYELWPEPVIPVDRRATDRSLAETAVKAYTALLGGPHPDAAALNDLLEVTAATEVGTEALRAYLTSVYDQVSSVLHAFTTPNEQSVRLTGRRADLPFTINNGLSTPARVVVVLQSDGRLEFPEGDAIELVLTPGRNRIALPIQARTSGDARLQVTVRSPDEARLLQLRSTNLIVRTTSLPGVGVALFVGALAVLAIWWIRATRLRSGKIRPAKAPNLLNESTRPNEETP